MQQHHYAKYKYNFQIDFLYVAYLSKLQKMNKKSQLTATSSDLLRCNRGNKFFQLMKSYLNNRTQVVSINNEISNEDSVVSK